MESTRKGGVVKRRNYEREGKRERLILYYEAGGIESLSNGGVSFKKKGESRKAEVKSFT